MKISKIKIKRSIIDEKTTVYSFILNDGKFSEIEFFFNSFYNSEGIKEILSRVIAISSIKSVHDEFFQIVDSEGIYRIEQDRVVLYAIVLDINCVIWGNGSQLPYEFVNIELTEELEKHLDNIKIVLEILQKNEISSKNINEFLEKNIR